MYKLICILFLSLVLSQNGVFAQGFTYTTTPVTSIPLSGTVTPSKINKDYYPSLQSLEKPKPGGEEYNSYLQEIKHSIKRRFSEIPENKSSLPRPVMGHNFEGNRFPCGVPNDNHMAISNDGIVVSSVNTSITVFDTLGKILKSWSFDAFSDTLKISAGKYDGRVLYDPEKDRFIVVFLAGFADSTSAAIVAFSQSKDPMAGWNLYKLSGVPLNDKTWSDFPMISITRDEMFLTLNAVKNGISWQKGFNQCYIWQINKLDGYAGTSLENKLYININYNGKPVRNICPIRGGAGLKGPESWFMSDRNFDKSNDSFFLYKIAGKLKTADTTMTMQVLTTTTNYGVAPNALQPFHDSLQTNDARILDGFIENNTIQIVGNSVYAPSGRAGFFHGIVSNVNSSPNMQLNLFGTNSFDFGYPAIAYAGRGSGDNDAIIVMDYSTDTIPIVNSKKIYTYPGNAAVFYKDNVYSDTVILRKGSSIIQLSGQDERWGDYSGAQLRYNHPGEVWVAATFGHSVKNGTGTYNAFGTWISQLSSNIQTAGIETQSSPVSNATLYPNPVMEYRPLIIDFMIEEEAILNFELYDLNGKLIRLLMRTKAEEGKNRFTFNMDALPRGTYLLKISGKEGKVLTKKVVVE